MNYYTTFISSRWEQYPRNLFGHIIYLLQIGGHQSTCGLTRCLLSLTHQVRAQLRLCTSCQASSGSPSAMQQLHSELIVRLDLNRSILALFSHCAAEFSNLILSQHEACYPGWSRFSQGPLVSVSHSRSPRRSRSRPSSTAQSAWVLGR